MFSGVSPRLLFLCTLFTIKCATLVCLAVIIRIGIDESLGVWIDATVSCASLLQIQRFSKSLAFSVLWIKYRLG